MKTQIRRGVFETNSSSVHSISIVKDSFNGSFPAKFTIDCNGEFGWEVDTFDDSSSKAAYIYQAIRYYFHYEFLKQIYVLYLFLINIESNLSLLKNDNT